MKPFNPLLKIFCTALLCNFLSAHTTAQSCGDLWVDDIGPIGYYQPEVYQEQFFCPNTAGGKVSLQFIHVDLPADTENDCTYYFAFYDDISSSSPLLAFYCGTTLIESNGSISDSVLSDGDILSATNESGCITAVFWTLDAVVVEYTGWEIYIDCAPPISCPAPTIATTTEMDCENMQYFTRLTVEEAPTGDSIPNLLVEFENPSVPGTQRDTILPNEIGESVLLGPFASQENIIFTISTPGYSCPVVTYSDEICPPLNDDCFNAYVITGDETVEGTLMGSEDGSVCFSITPEVTSGVGAYMCIGYTDIVASLSVSADEEDIVSQGFVDCDILELPYVEFVAQAGNTYYITLSGYAPSWLGSSYLMYSIGFSVFPLECDDPDLNLTIVDEAGNSLDCSPWNSEIYVSATLTNAPDSTDYIISNELATATLQNDSTAILGPFNVGPQMTFKLTEADNSWCFSTHYLNTVCNTTLQLTTEYPALCPGRLAKLSLYKPDSQVLVHFQSRSINEEGEVVFPNLPVGTFDLYLKPEGYLQVYLGQVELLPEENLAIIPAVFQAGDITGNNGINVADASAISSSFNTGVADPGYNYLADFNCDNYISILDFSAIIPGFNTTGAVPPPN